ncbi:MAG: AlwI family type II restriction endonuclease [Bacteroidales bacterium]|jgi:hypothetical protein|nr:AlwI family type II restriction endonuclease [Bacteroidales bacterium]
MRAPKYKPLLFTTTVRNPERLKMLLSILIDFNQQILSNELATTIVCQLIRYGLYRPQKQKASIKNKWNTTPEGVFADYILSDSEVEWMKENNPQKHKEAGFNKGYPSRFATFFDFAKELGFVYFEIEKPIEFSEIGKRYASIFSIEIGNEGEIITRQENPEYEQQAFLQAMSKYQRNNPFIRVLNDNIPLILLLQTIKKLNSDSDFNGNGISRKELPLIIFWKDNNDEALYQRIRKLRKEYGYNPSDEVIIDICLEEIMEGDMKKFKNKSIISEYPDEFIRKMRLTGLFSLRGAGRFLDINHNEDKKVDYILEHYSKYSKFKTEREYFDYMSQIDENLFEIKPIVLDIKKSEELLSNWLKIYTWNNIKEELHILGTKNKMSKDNILRFLSNPMRMEFLTSLAIKSKFPHVRVIPNYPCDDEGLPTSTAGGIGNKGDIDCIEYKNGILVEVTLAEGRMQTIMEIWPISRHLEAFQQKYKLNSQCIFIAPSIFKDSEKQIKYVKAEENLQIYPFTINEFINYIENATQLYKI